MKNDGAKTLKIGSRERSRLIFYISLLIYPVVQFSIFYIYVNFNSVKMAFWTYREKVGTVGYESVFSGLDNFKAAFEILIGKSYMIVNSLKYFGIKLLTGYILAILFSFYIYKEYPCSGFFRVILFLPQIVSGLIFSVIFKEMANNVYPQLAQLFTGQTAKGLMLGSESDFPIVVFFNIWISFGVDILLISNAMSGISGDVVEASQIDGVNIVQEFWYVTLPSVYPTLVSLLIIMTTGLFTDQLNLYGLYGNDAEHFGSLGYYLYKHAVYLSDPKTASSEPTFSQLSAIGVILTLIMVPLTLGIRKLLNRLGPSDEREGKVR